MNELRLYKNGSLMNSYELYKCDLPRNLRDYLGPDLPEFKRSYKEVIDLLSEQLSPILGLYLINGGYLVESEDDVISNQLPIINFEGDYVVMFSYMGSIYDKVEIEIDEEVFSADLPTPSSVSKKTIEFVITSSKEVNLINLFNSIDDQVVGFKTKVNEYLFSIMPTNKVNEVQKYPYQNGNYGLHKLVEQDEVSYDPDQIFQLCHNIEDYKI